MREFPGVDHKSKANAVLSKAEGERGGGIERVVHTWRNWCERDARRPKEQRRGSTWELEEMFRAGQELNERD